VLVFSKLDRLFRSTRDCTKFAEWAEQHSKLLVFAEDGLTLNYRGDRDKSSIEGMMSELFVYLGSFFAQLELNRFKTRALDGHRVLRQTSRWASGVPPLGFRVVGHPSGKGKGLATDTEGKDLLYGMAERLLAGWSFVRIAAWLNEFGALTSMDRARVANGKEPNGRPWTVSTVIDALTSPRTQGFKMHKGQTVLDGDGEPIVLGPPTFEPDKWRADSRCCRAAPAQPADSDAID
jgi:site-specific DNA recombinase